MATRRVPALRESTFEPDTEDGARVQYNRRLWTSQDLLLQGRDRMVEENIRMLAGQQWGVWSRLLGKWVDVTTFLDDKERRWRQRPVINRLFFWYMLTKARMTENPPVVTFQPATGDRIDAELAAVYDTIFKILYSETGMLEVLDWVFSWLIPGGRAHWKTRVDLNLGDMKEARGPASLQLLGPEGGAILGPDGEPIEREFPDVPFAPDPQNPGGPFIPGQTQQGQGGEWEVTGKAFSEREGGLVVDPLTCLEVRGQWSNAIPWHRKSWHQHHTYLTPEEVFDAYGIEMDPEIRGDDADRIGELRRIQFGSGFFGAIEHSPYSFGTDQGQTNADVDGFVEVFESWHRPSRFPGMEEGEGQPGGRLLTTSRTKCLRDGARPAALPYTSPIRCVDFVRVPGRPSGSTPQEALNPLQRTYNRGWAQILEHRNLMTNPKGIIDTNSGLNEGMVSNAPGEFYYISRSATGVPPIEYVSPQRLGEDVWRTQDALRGEMQDLGNIEGAEGRIPSRDPSGELVKELRFNSDRFVGPSLRGVVIEIGRMAEDWKAILSTIWTEEKALAYGGEEQMVRTITVRPELFREGKLNVIPDVESMLPEGRGERQSRVFSQWQAGAWGDPRSPAAIKTYLDQSRFPHMDRATRPGGMDRVKAELENGMLAQGVAQPTLEWYEDQIHIEVHEDFMKSPEYLRLPIEAQQAFVEHRANHIGAMLAKQKRNLAMAVVQAGEQAEARGAVAAVDSIQQRGLMNMGPDVTPATAESRLPQSREAVEGGAPGLDQQRREA